MDEDLVICRNCGVCLDKCYVKKKKQEINNFDTSITAICPVCRTEIYLE